MKLFHFTLWLAFFAACGCAQPYPKSEALMKAGEPLVVPAEFKNGTASLEQVKAWSASQLSILWNQPHLEIMERDLNQDGTNDLLIAETHMGGTGGNSYLAFERTPKGYRYLGDLAFGAMRVLPKDESHHQKILTYWHLSCNEGTVALLILDATGFHEFKHTTIHPGDSGTEEGNKIYEELFGTNIVSPETLRLLFGK